MHFFIFCKFDLILWNDENDIDELDQSTLKRVVPVFTIFPLWNHLTLSSIEDYRTQCIVTYLKFQGLHSVEQLQCKTCLLYTKKPWHDNADSGFRNHVQLKSRRMAKSSFMVFGIKRFTTVSSCTDIIN